ncbi:hypothetical protein BD289DRAFT_353975, partial [Coniella lustricola]
YSDGEIFCKLSSKNLDFSERKDWLQRLSPCKESSLHMLFGHAKITEAFNRLLLFPGLWVGLQLGNIHKHLALHCEQEILNYLEYVFVIWRRITNEDEALAQAVDVRTVKTLQYLIPRSQDAQEIKAAFTNTIVFPDVIEDGSRKLLLRNILNIDGFVPSIATFHKDTMYLSHAIKAIKKWISPRFKSRNLAYSSLRDVLKADFQPNDKIVIQLAESEWEELPGRPNPDFNNRFDLAYQQLIIAALRWFASLSNESPLQEVREKRLQGFVSDSHVNHFQAVAQRLGFKTRKV